MLLRDGIAIVMIQVMWSGRYDWFGWVWGCTGFIGSIPTFLEDFAIIVPPDFILLIGSIPTFPANTDNLRFESIPELSSFGLRPECLR